MARARNIKPGFFANEELAECEPLARLMFAGLWCLADREGRLEDRPKRIRVALLPYDACDPDALLNQLQAHGFIERYVVDGQSLIQVNGFTKHQMPHHKEVASSLPPVPGSPAITRHGYDVSKELRAAVFERDGNECLKCGTKEALTIDHIVPLSKGGDNEASNLQTLCHRCNASKGDATKSYRSDVVEIETRRSNYRQGSSLGQRHSNDDASCPTDSLIPDSLSLDSLIADSLIPDCLEKLADTDKSEPVAETLPAVIEPKPAKQPKGEETDHQRACRSTWDAYSDAYRIRYGTDPVRNAKVNSQVKQLVLRLGGTEAPGVAAFFVTINDAFYIRRAHELGILISNAEGIRTQWATGRQMNGTTARQLEQTQANMNAALEAGQRIRDKGGKRNAFL